MEETRHLGLLQQLVVAVVVLIILLWLVAMVVLAVVRLLMVLTVVRLQQVKVITVVVLVAMVITVVVVVEQEVQVLPVLLHQLKPVMAVSAHILQTSLSLASVGGLLAAVVLPTVTAGHLKALVEQVVVVMAVLTL
jgi:hypothetical protein